MEHEIQVTLTCKKYEVTHFCQPKPLKIICTGSFNFIFKVKMNAQCCEKQNNAKFIKLSFLVLEILTVEVVHISIHESMSNLPH